MSSTRSDHDLLSSDQQNHLQSHNSEYDIHSIRSVEITSDTHHHISSLHLYPEDVEEYETIPPIDLTDNLLLTFKSEEEKEHRVHDNESSLKEVRTFASETSENDKDFFKARYVDDSNKCL
uniref:Ovule protein n=1 Tax=Strongyloides venezuelensis TaxID=75913 RepID=A0A0K0FDK2_STRVS